MTDDLFEGPAVVVARALGRALCRQAAVVQGSNRAGGESVADAGQRLWTLHRSLSGLLDPSRP